MLLWSTWTPLTTMPTFKIFDVYNYNVNVNTVEMNNLCIIMNSVEYNINRPIHVQVEILTSICLNVAQP